MDSAFSINIMHFVVILLNILGVFFALWVYLSNRRSRLNQGLCLMVALIILWISFYHLASLPPQQKLTLTFFKLSGASVFLFFIAYYFFIIRWFLQKRGFYKHLGKLIIAYGSISALLTLLTDYIIPAPQLKNNFLAPLFSQVGGITFYGYVILLTVLINSVLLREYFASSERTKLKIQYFSIGMLLFAVLNFVFNVILPVFFNNYGLYQFGNYSAIFLIGFTAYAIVKQKLFGIKVVLTQLLVGIMAIFLLIDVIGSETTFEYVWKGGLLAGFLLFGWLLVKSVVREIKQKEKLDKLASKLGATNIKLKKLDKAKSEFVSIASHQLRTPLTAIKGYVSMLLSGDYGKMPKTAKHPLKNVFLSNERLIKLVNALLNISRIEAGKVKLNKASMQIDKLLTDLTEEFTSRVKEKGLYLKLVIPKTKVPKIIADQQKLHEVISNLIDNAIKYTKHGGITIKLSAVKKKVRIVVQDTGAGLTKEEMAKLFHSFSRAGAGKRLWIEGAGLGLYVAKKFVTMHKGKIYVESPGKGKGSTFHIELPIK